MNNICIVIRLCLQNFKRWISNPRIYFIGILLTVYISSVVFPLVSFCYSVETSITPWLFPLLTSNQEGLIIFTACIILLFCDAPFLDSTQPFYIIRSGRQKWILAQILYIFLASILFFTFIYLVSTIILFPVTHWQMDWGKIFYTLSLTDARTMFQIPLMIPYEILKIYSPIQAFGLSFLLNVLVSTFLGLLIFTINLKLSKIMGSIVAAAPTLLTSTIFFNDFFLIYYIPVAWASLDKIDITGTQLLPSLPYVLTVLISLIVLLSILSFLFFRKKAIEISPQI